MLPRLALALLLTRSGEFGDATVTICHSRTPDLAAECRSADFLFLAIGRPRLITGDMVRQGAVVIDVGINRGPDGLCGDADYESVSAKASAITPVPGGVGPMTIAMLLKNTVQSWRGRTASSTSHLTCSNAGHGEARREDRPDGRPVGPCL